MKKRRKLKYNLKCNHAPYGVRCKSIAIEFWQWESSDMLSMRCSYHPFKPEDTFSNRVGWHKIDPGEAAILEVLIV